MLEVTCAYCGTVLPEGAFFCAECGRAVDRSAPTRRDELSVTPPAAEPPPPSPIEPPPFVTGPPPTTGPPLAAVAEPVLPERSVPRPPIPEYAEPEPPVAEPPVSDVPSSDDPPRCEQCGAEMSPDDIFCGECGHVSRAVSQSFSQPRDTVVVERLTAERLPWERPERDARPDEPIVWATTPPPPPVVPPQEPPMVAPPVQAGPPPLVSPPQMPPSVPPVGLGVTGEPLAGRTGPAAPIPAASVPAASVPTASVPAASVPFDGEDLEKTRIVGRAANGNRFVLQFSTGESVTVFGTGLIGRNPRQEPGEFFDQLVRVLDPGRSVSKTHLEFGQESGAFWIKDRFSGNGTVLREPDAPPVRCQPERRYLVPRGSRVEIGEQFFVVS